MSLVFAATYSFVPLLFICNASDPTAPQAWLLNVISLFAYAILAISKALVTLYWYTLQTPLVPVMYIVLPSLLKSIPAALGFWLATELVVPVAAAEVISYAVLKLNSLKLLPLSIVIKTVPVELKCIPDKTVWDPTDWEAMSVRVTACADDVNEVMISKLIFNIINIFFIKLNPLLFKFRKNEYLRILIM